MKRLRCSVCGKAKLTREFYRNRSKDLGARDGRNSYCKGCASQRHKEWREKNRERHAANVKAWCDANPARAMVNTARSRATRARVPFAITVEDVERVLEPMCPVLGIPLVRGDGCGPKPDSPSLIQVDPQLGWVPGNIAVVSVKATRLGSGAAFLDWRASLEARDWAIDCAIEQALLDDAAD